MQKTLLILIAAVGLLSVCNSQAQNSISSPDELDNLDKVAEMDAKQYFEAHKPFNKNDTNYQITIFDAPYTLARYHNYTGAFKDIYVGEFWQVLDSLIDGTYRAPATTANLDYSSHNDAAGSVTEHIETTQEQIDRAEYKKNVKSGKWKEFKNGE